MIPKTIHLCWLSGDEYPPKIKKCIQSWKRHLPDYEIMLWDTKQFNLNESLWVKQAFEAKKYAFAADYIRFYALYHYGGIYLDSDVEVLKSFDDLLDRPYFLGAETSGYIEAAVIGAEKGCDWVKKCLDYYTDRHFIQADGTLDITMLPRIMGPQIEQLKPLRLLTHEMTRTCSVTAQDPWVSIFPNDWFSPKVFDSRKVYRTENTYAIHHYADSWFSSKALLYYRLRTFFVRFLGVKTVYSIECFLMPWKFKKKD